MSQILKLFLAAILIIGFSADSNAQLWKKIKNKTKQKIEDRAADKISDKIAEAVMGKMTEKVESESNPYKVNIGSRVSKPENLQEEYKFDWKYQVKMTSKSTDDDTRIDYMLPEEGNYFGYMIPEAEDMFSVIDFENGAMISYMEEEGNSFALTHDYPQLDYDELENTESGQGVNVSELADKIILGYNAKGFKYETDRTIMIVYFTEEADVSFSGFGTLPNQGLPLTYGSQLNISKDALMLYMKFSDKDNPENEMEMECVGLDKEKLTKKNSEYNFL